MENSEKIIVIDGKIIDLEKTSMEELLKIRKELEDKEKQIIEKIDKLLER